MPKFDFDAVIPRTGTNSVKWDIRPDVLPMWVADMDFRVAPCITEALHRKVDHGIFGYTHPLDAYYNAVSEWFGSRRGWHIDRDSIIPVSGLVPGLSICIKALTEPGDKVVMNTPAYNCFFSSIRNTGAVLAASPLLRRGDSFELNFDEIEALCSDPSAKVLLLCNPHNPSGRIWTREELERLAGIALSHGMYVISDEIHCELEMPGHRYIPFASLSGEVAQRCVSLISPTKSFNIAGIQVANLVAANPEIRSRLDRVINDWEHCDINQFGVVALQAAYSPEGAGWLEELNAYLWDNYLVLKEMFKRDLPDYPVMRLEGTYLVWVDCGASKVSTQRIQDSLIEHEKVWINGGEMYGDPRYIRINIACPRSLLTEGVSRVIAGIRRLNGNEQ